MRASDPALPEDASAASNAIADADRRIRANITIGTELKYRVPMSETTFIFEVEEMGPDPLKMVIRLRELILGETPLPAPQPSLPSSPIIPQHRPDPRGTCEYLKAGNCYWCCETCNTDSHRCLGCGEPVDHNGFESNGEKHTGCTD